MVFRPITKSRPDYLNNKRLLKFHKLSDANFTTTDLIQLF